MGGGASSQKGDVESTETKLHACLFDVFDLLGANTKPTSKDISGVVTNAAQTISDAGYSMLFFKDEIKMRLLYLPPGGTDFDSVDLDHGGMGGAGFIGQVAMNGALFNEAKGSAVWDAMAGQEPSFKHYKEEVTSCMCVPVLTVDKKVVGVIVTLGGAKSKGFTAAHARSVSLLAEKVVPLITRFGADVVFQALDDKEPGDAGLRSMLGNFGRGDKRDVKVLMKKSVNKLLMVRRLSAVGIGEVVDAANDGGGELDLETSEQDQDILEEMSVWGPAVLHLEEEKMGMMAEVMITDLVSTRPQSPPQYDFQNSLTAFLRD